VENMTKTFWCVFSVHSVVLALRGLSTYLQGITPNIGGERVRPQE